MTTQEVIERVRAWVESRVCPLLEYKRAHLYEETTEHGYTHTYVHPAAYSVGIPREAQEMGRDADEARPVVAPCCVVATCGESTYSQADRSLETPLELRLQVWHPGHIETGPGEQQEIVIDGEGWRDAATFADTLLREIINAETINGLAVIGDITIDHPDPEDTTLYPYYRAALRCSVKHFRPQINKFEI